MLTSSPTRMPVAYRNSSDRAVAAAEVGVYVGRFDKPNGVFHRKMIGQLALDLRRGDELCGV